MPFFSSQMIYRDQEKKTKTHVFLFQLSTKVTKKYITKSTYCYIQSTQNSQTASRLFDPI